MKEWNRSLYINQISATIFLPHDPVWLLTVVFDQFGASHLSVLELDWLRRLRSLVLNWSRSFNRPFLFFCYLLAVLTFLWGDMNVSPLHLIWFHEILTSFIEQFLQVFSSLGWDFDEMSPYVFKFFFSFFSSNCPLLRKIYFVSHYKYDDLFPSMFLDVVNPGTHIFKSLPMGHIIN